MTDVATEHVPPRDRPKEMEQELLRMQRRFTDPDDRVYRSENVRAEYRRLHRRWVAAKDQLTL